MSFVGIFLIPMVQPSAQGGDLGLAKLLPLVGRSGTAVAPGATAGDRGCQLVHQLLASQGQFGAIQGDRVCDGARTQHFGFAQVNQHGTLLSQMGRVPGPSSTTRRRASATKRSSPARPTPFPWLDLMASRLVFLPASSGRARPSGDKAAAIGSAELTEP